MFLLGVILIAIGILNWFLGWFYGNLLTQQLHLIAAAGTLISGSIFVVGEFVVNSIQDLKLNNDGLINNTNKGFVEYIVVLSDESEYRVKASKNSKWDDIISSIKEKGIVGEVHYIIDEDGRKVFKGGYLG